VTTWRGIDLHKLQQVVKWIVYGLLIINWGFYILEDWDRAIHTLGPGSTLLDWTGEFATSIDESGWFVLLFMFELETYVLDDENLTGWTAKAIHTARLACFLMILHTVYAFAVTVDEYEATIPVDNASSLCDLTDKGLSFVYNLDYTEVTEQSCGELSTASQFFMVGVDPVVSTEEGLILERQLAWGDLIEVVMWLLIIAAMELVVRLQDRGITGGKIISTANRLKLASYLVLFALAVWWATLSHWLYTWDTFVWIAGFAAIEMNISEWRDEIQEETKPALAEG
jgi:hypothetical protein